MGKHGNACGRLALSTRFDKLMINVLCDITNESKMQNPLYLLGFVNMARKFDQKMSNESAKL